VKELFLACLQERTYFESGLLWGSIHVSFPGRLEVCGGSVQPKRRRNLS